MTAILKLFSALLALLCIINESQAGECSAHDIVITQAKTGKIIEGKPEYEVSVSNKCSCGEQSNVIVKCFGLNSVEPVDPNAIKPLDDKQCIVNGGRPIAFDSPVKFRYAWLTPQDFPVVSSKVKC